MYLNIEKMAWQFHMFKLFHCQKVGSSNQD